MKKNLVYIPLLAAVLVVSCSKKDDDTKPTTTTSTTATTASTATTATTATTSNTASTSSTATTSTTSTTATTGTTSTNSSIQITVDSDPVFRGTVDGVFYYMSTTSGYQNNTGSDKNIPPPGEGMSSASYTSAVVNSSETKGLGIGKGILQFNGTQPERLEFNAFFAKGIVPFQTENDKQGIVLGWLNNGEYWSSDLGDQTGSSFTINDISENIFGMTIKASFSCKLYSSDGSRSIVVSNGEYVGQYNND